MRYYAEGGPDKDGDGFIVIQHELYRIGNDVEAFTIALSNMAVAVMLRQERFHQHLLHRRHSGRSFAWKQGEGDKAGGQAGAVRSAACLAPSNHEVWQRIQGLINPVPPEGYGDVRRSRSLMPKRSSRFRVRARLSRKP